MASDRQITRGLRRWALPWLIAIGLTSAAATPAVAQDKPDELRSPTETEKETARTLMLEGRAKEAAGDLAGALDDYEAADALMRLPTTGLSVGRLRARLGKLVEARTILLRVGRFPVNAGTAGVLLEAREDALAEADALAARIPSLVVTLPADVEAAALEIAVDGGAVASALVGRAMKVNPGSHRITASRGGNVLFERQLELAEKDQQTVAVEIVAAALAAAAPAPGLAAPPASQGEADEGAGEQEGGMPVLAWIGFGVAGAGLIAGGVAGTIALLRTGELHDACPDDVCSPAEQDAYDDANVAAHTATIGFAVAGAGAALGLLGLLLGDDGSEDTAAVEPLLGPSFWGVRTRF